MFLCLEQTVNVCTSRPTRVVQLKGRVRAQQLEREKEQTDHAVMIRELQKLLANERQVKEQIEHQVRSR